MTRPWSRKLVCLALATTTACGGDNSGPSNGNGELTARINGEAFSSQFTSVQRGGGSVFVNGGGANQRAIGFTFPDQGTGTYTIAPGVLVAAGVSIGPVHYTAGQSSGAGTINVTTFTDSRLVGSFVLTVVAGSSTLSITDGQFDIDY
jgi:hypothetical protein